MPWSTARVLILVTLLGNPMAAHADDAPTRAPLKTRVWSGELQKLTPERRALVSETAAIMEQDLFYWSSFPLVLPPSAFAEDAEPLFSQEELFRTATDDELAQLALGPDGNPVPLSEEQLTQVREMAAFSVPSRRYPGQKHVWQLSELLQQGSKVREENAQQEQAEGLRTILYTVPSRIVGEESLSMRNALAHVGSGIRGTAGALVGLPERHARYSRAGVEELVRAQMLAAALQTLQEDPSRGDHTLWKTPDGNPVDLRVFETALWDHARAPLDRILTEQAAAWQRDAVQWQRRTEEELRQQGVPEMDLPQLLADRAADEQEERYLRAVEASPQLEALSPGLGKLYGQQVRAIRIAATEHLAHQKAVMDHRERFLTALRTAHPVKARITEWLEAEVSSEMRPFQARESFLSHQRTASQLRGAGLGTHAWLLERHLAFLSAEGDMRRRALAQEKVTARTFNWDYDTWRTTDWVVERTSTRNSDGSVSTRCTGNSYRRLQVPSSVPFWRIGNLVHRTGSWFNNSARFLLHDNLWNGAFGLRSLVGDEAFLSEDRFNTETCQVEGDPYSETQTMRSRLRALWKDVHDSREEFEAEPDTGLLGKNITRVFNRVWNYGLKGGAGTVLLLAGQPALTAINLVATGFLVATSVVWVPLASLAVMPFNALIFDFENTENDFFSSFFPLFAYGIGHIGLAGAGQFIVASTDVVVVEPLLLGLGAVASKVRDGVRFVYDGITYRLILRPFGRVPAVDSFTARRVEGPGLSAQVFFQVPPEVPVLALAAQLEKEELAHFKRMKLRQLDQPVEEYDRFLREVFGPFVSVEGQRNHASALFQSDAEYRKQLQEALTQRETHLAALVAVPERGRIRMTRADLEQTLAKGRQMVETAYQERIFPLDSDGQRAQFWGEHKLAEGDWQGLAKQLLATAFSDGILEPLQDSDATLHLEVQHARLERFVAALEKGRGPGDDLTHVTIPRKSVEPAKTPTRPFITHQELNFVSEMSTAGYQDSLETESRRLWQPWNDETLTPALTTWEEPQNLIHALGPGFHLRDFLRSRGITRPGDPAP